jgi:hypothetical protein
VFEGVDGVLAPVIVSESTGTLTHEELVKVWEAMFVELHMSVSLHFLTVWVKYTIGRGGRVVTDEYAWFSPVTCIRGVGRLSNVSESEAAERGQLESSMVKGGCRPRLKRRLKFSEELPRNGSCQELLCKVFVSKITKKIWYTRLFEVDSRSFLDESNSAFSHAVSVMWVGGATSVLDAVVCTPILKNYARQLVVDTKVSDLDLRVSLKALEIEEKSFVGLVVRSKSPTILWCATCNIEGLNVSGDGRSGVRSRPVNMKAFPWSVVGEGERGMSETLGRTFWVGDLAISARAVFLPLCDRRELGLEGVTVVRSANDKAKATRGTVTVVAM